MIYIWILIKINSYVVEKDNYRIDTQGTNSTRKIHVRFGYCGEKTLDHGQNNATLETI